MRSCRRETGRGPLILLQHSGGAREKTEGFVLYGVRDQKRRGHLSVEKAKKDSDHPALKGSDVG